MSDQLDIYEFPADYTGRKTYVRVAGHSKLIARCYVYVGADGRSYLHPDYGGGYEGVPPRTDLAFPTVMKAMGEYTSPVDGKVISSRDAHRDHLKRHNLVEVGNEPIGNMSREDSTTSGRVIGETIKRHLDEVRAMPQRQYNDHVSTKVQAHAG